MRSGRTTPTEPGEAGRRAAGAAAEGAAAGAESPGESRTGAVIADLFSWIYEAPASGSGKSAPESGANSSITFRCGFGRHGQAGKDGAKDRQAGGQAGLRPAPAVRPRPTPAPGRRTRRTRY